MDIYRGFPLHLVVSLFSVHTRVEKEKNIYMEARLTLINMIAVEITSYC